MISCCVALPLAFFVELEPCWKCRDLGAALTAGKQQMVFCSQNAGIHVLELKPGTDAANPGNVAGLQMFNIVDHLPPDIRTGGSVEGLDDCYMNEGSA